MPHNEETPSEAKYWNDPDVAADLRSRQDGVTEFAQEVEAGLARHSKVLEVGCSAGDDSAFFAQQGHDVIAIDVSEPLIELAYQRYADLSGVDFRVADITQPLAIGGGTLDAVYARLSLQYFDHHTTLQIFSELAWVLRPGGQFHFACRSTEDPLFGKGDRVEQDMFELQGHCRHFFSTDYAVELLEANGFTKIEVSNGRQDLYGEKSAFVRASALKP